MAAPHSGSNPSTGSVGTPGAALGSEILAAAALFLLVLVSYAPLRNAHFIWDDEDYVTANTTLRTADGLRRIWFEIGAVPQYYPLVHTTFWIEYHLWELAPLGYHLFNVLLHALSALLVWRLLWRLQVPGAWLAAALFAVHPVEVESVAWITERKNVLSLALALGSLLCYLRFAPTDAEASVLQGGRRWRWYGLALALFVGAMLSKTVVATLPAVVLVICWWKQGRIVLRDIWPLIPFFAVGASLGLLTAWMEKYRVGAEGADWEFSLVDRVLIAGRVLWFYAAKLAWPSPLAFFYARWQITQAGWQYLFPLAAVALVLSLWLARCRIGRGPLAAVLVFGGVLVPALGFFNVYPFRYSFVADHFQYHSSIALLALAAAVATNFWRSWSPMGQLVGQLLAAALLLVCCTLTFRQTYDYSDLETLYRQTIRKSPDSWLAYLNLGALLESSGRFDEGVEVARQAVRLNPDEPGVHNNLGASLLRLGIRDGFAPGQLEEIVAELQRALELGQTRPGLSHIAPVVHSNLAFALLKLGTRDGFRPGQMDNIFRHLGESLRLNPDYAGAHATLGFALLAAGRPQEGAEHFAAALRSEPDSVQSLCGMGTALSSLSRAHEAKDNFVRALTLDADCAAAHYGLALLLVNEHRVDEAVGHLEAGLRNDPQLAEAHYTMGGILTGRGDLAAAAAEYQKAIEIRPNYHLALNNLGVVSVNMGDLDAAAHYFQEAVRYQPDYAEARANLDKVQELQREQRTESPRAQP